jgi:hypothetical protein
MSKLQEKPSVIKREHPALQNKIFLNLFPFMSLIFGFLDPDPDPKHYSHGYRAYRNLTFDNLI